MSNDREERNEIIDIHELMDEYKRYWYVFVISVVICVTLGFFYARINPPKYTVRANVLVSQDTEKAGGNGLKAMFGDMSNMFGSSGEVEDEVFMASSHSVLRDAIKALGANTDHRVKTGFLQSRFEYKEYPIDVTCPEAMLDTLMATVQFKIKVNDKGLADIKVRNRGKVIAELEDTKLPTTVNTRFGAFRVVPTKYFEKGEKLTTTVTVSGYNTAAEIFSSMVRVALANKKANVIEMTFTSVDTQFAKDLINEIIKKYNERGVHDRNEKSIKTRDFIEERLALLSGELGDSEMKVQEFKTSQGMTDPEAGVTYEYTRKGTIETELIKAETDANIYKVLYDFIADPRNNDALMPSAPAQLETAGEGVAGYNKLMLQRMELQRNPRGNQAALAKIDEQLAAMRVNLSTSLSKAYQSSQSNAAKLRAEMSKSDTRLGKVPYQERVYRDLERQKKLKEELYIFLLTRLEEASMTLANSTAKGIIVDEAFSMTEPVGMQRNMILILSFVLGMLLAPLLLYIRRLTRNKFESKDALEKLTKVPVLGEVCTSRRGGHLVVKPGGSTSVAELFRLIRTNLQFVLNDKDDKVVLMTSTVSGEGKSFISINLASSLALLGKKVLLVGMDIRAPKLAEYLPIQSRHGLTEYLARTDIPLSDIIIPDAVQEGMDIIISGPVPPNPSELLLSHRVDELFEQLRTMYDYIIVDSAPVGMVSDSFALTRISDATVYVCRANYTTLRDVRFFNDLYADKRLHKMSLVVNGTSARKGYGYGYGEGEHNNGKKRKKRN